jgi:hypothetical protein
LAEVVVVEDTEKGATSGHGPRAGHPGASLAVHVFRIRTRLRGELLGSIWLTSATSHN